MKSIFSRPNNIFILHIISGYIQLIKRYHSIKGMSGNTIAFNSGALTFIAYLSR